MKKGQRKLPMGWRWVRTTDVLDPTQKRPIRMGPFGSQLKKDELVEDGIFVLGIKHVINKKFDDKGYKFITNDKFKQLKGFEVKPGDVLITTMGTIGRTAVVPTGIRKTIISSHLLKLTLKSDVYPEYIAWVLGNNSPVYKRLTQVSQGAIMQGLNTDIVKNLRFPIPLDLNGQIMICKKLESKMAEVEKMRQAALREKEAVEVFREALLRRYFPYKVGDPLPKGWQWHELGDILKFKNGINFSSSEVGQGTLTLDVYNMYTETLQPQLNNLYRVNKDISNEYLLKENDILFVRSSVKREGVGWPTVFKGYEEPVSFCGFIIRGRLVRDDIIPQYLVLYSRMGSVREKFISASGQTTITNISQDNLRRVRVPIPSKKQEQNVIVEKIENKFIKMEKMQQSSEKQLEAIQALPAAILHEVFDFQEASA